MALILLMRSVPMKKTSIKNILPQKAIIFIVVLFSTYCIDALADQPNFDVQKISRITGIKGEALDKGVFKLSVPRTDIPIRIDGWKLPPFMGVTSWISFMKGRQQDVMLMGDLVLFQDEVNPVIDVLLDGGLEVTALHNHFFYDKPKVYFLHISGEGNIAKTAITIKNVFEKIKEIRDKAKTPQETFDLSSFSSKSNISYQPLEKLFNQKSSNQNGMVKFVFGRLANMSCGCQVGKDMGVNTWAAFAGTDENAVVAGDFAVLGEELQAVLTALRQAGINIVAIHHHMIGENPKYYFLHYWGVGQAEALAKGLHEALAKTQK